MESTRTRFHDEGKGTEREADQVKCEVVEDGNERSEMMEYQRNADTDHHHGKDETPYQTSAGASKCSHYEPEAVYPDVPGPEQVLS